MTEWGILGNVSGAKAISDVRERNAGRKIPLAQKRTVILGPRNNGIIDANFERIFFVQALIESFELYCLSSRKRVHPHS